MQTRKSKGAVVVPCAKFLKCNSGRWMDGSGYFWLSSTYLSLQDTIKALPVQLFQPNQLSLSDKPKTRVDAQVLHGWLLTDEGGFYPSFYLNTTCSTLLGSGPRDHLVTPPADWVVSAPHHSQAVNSACSL